MDLRDKSQEGPRLMSARPATLVDLLYIRAQQDPDWSVYTWLKNGEAIECALTCEELHRKACALATQFQEWNLEGERALLLYEPGLDFIVAFFACLYAGVVAIPMPVPSQKRGSRQLRSVCSDASPRLALGLKRQLEALHQSIDPYVRRLATDQVSFDGEDRWVRPTIDASTLAYLQYTSGSTGNPKGVMISHGNVLSNLAYISSTFSLDDKSVFVSWLPHFHDMGLVSVILLAVYGRCTSYLFTPASFVQQPLRWLRAISTHKATQSGAPNFAFDLCARQITDEQVATLDLSSWKVAYTGAETINAGTLERFVRKFRAAGFHPEAIYPTYGLAEATLKVAGASCGRGSISISVDADGLNEKSVKIVPDGTPRARILVGSGKVDPPFEIRIVGPDTAAVCGLFEVGEIWVRAPSTGQGYWSNPTGSARTFQAFTENGDGPFLRTGDLGFVHRRELYIVGRIKDCIIVRGHNYYPDDIEQAVRDGDPAFESNHFAAFHIETQDGEKLVVAVELTRQQRKNDLDSLIRKVRRIVANACDLHVHDVVLVSPAALPKTTSGKIQRNETRAAYLSGNLKILKKHVIEQEVSRPSVTTETSKQQHNFSQIRDWILRRLAQRLDTTADKIDVELSFADYGLDSKDTLRMSGDLADFLGRPIEATALYEHSTVNRLAGHLAMAPLQSQVSRKSTGGRIGEPIAITGIGCRFPAARGVDAFWNLLRAGVDAVGEVPIERWDWTRFYHPEGTHPGKTNSRWGGFLDRIDEFDAGLFGISPLEAAGMDPQQRLLLETAWEAIEDAGLTKAGLAGSRMGVFVGISNNDYARLQFDDLEQIDGFAGTGNALSIAANRLSYTFDLRGPSMAVDTACSSSLAAVHLACESIRSGESEAALVAGVNLILSPAIAINFTKAGMMSPDGRCRAFDAKANGIVRSEGVGVVVLKPLSEALAAGDPIYCVIRGSAANQDGRTNGLKAPNPASQVEVLQEAYSRAGVSPGSIRYVEAHGTGTLLGDAAELQALSRVLGEGRASTDFGWLGSVKTNIGHAESAAGIAGLIKTALSIRHQEIPPSLHFQTPNPHLDTRDVQLQVPTEVQRWGSREKLAGVSSFGFGGTNVHVVLSEAPSNEEVDGAPVEAVPAEAVHAHLLLISGASPASCAQAAAAYERRLFDTGPSGSLEAICASAAKHRDHHRYRMAVVGNTVEEIAHKLGAYHKGSLLEGVSSGNGAMNARMPAFIFSGYGSQWPGMGRSLLRCNPVFREFIETCHSLLLDMGAPSLLALLSGDSDSQWANAEAIQPAIFAVQAGVATVWRSWGIQPSAVIGQSSGEITAAYVAGALSLEQALLIVRLRSKLLVQNAVRGGMALVNLPATEVAQLLNTQWVAIAGTTSPRSTLISGQEQEVISFVQSCDARGVFARRIDIDYASHGPTVESLRDSFIAGLGGLLPAKPQIPLYSTVTGALLTDAVLDGVHWWRNLREPVAFTPSFMLMLESGIDCFLECSAHPVLAVPMRECLQHAGREAQVLFSSRRQQDEAATLLGALGSLYARGVSAAWDQVFPSRRRASLPTYAFDRKRYWIQPKSTAESIHDGQIAVPSENRPPASKVDRQRQTVISRLQAMLGLILRIEPREVDIHRPFVEMGADSIVLLTATRQLETEFGVTLTVRQMLETHTTLSAVAELMTSTDKSPVLAEEDTQPSIPRKEAVPATAPTEVGSVIAQQLATYERIVAAQIELLKGSNGNAAAASVASVGVPEVQVSGKRATPGESKRNSEVYVPYQEARPGKIGGLTPRQHDHVKELVVRYNSRTAKSKRLTQEFRPVLADNRASAGFRYSIKEMLYPLQVARSEGAKIWDVDGNEYVDLTMGFGVTLFGHGAEFITDALKQQIDRGIQLGPQSDQAGPVASLISELTGMPRVAFCNSGTEAVMMALRLARTATSRKKIALFTGSYHGTFDSVLALPDGSHGSSPAAPGITRGAVEDVLALDYADPASLNLIRENASELAAVLVEPVQSRRPDLQPKEFLQELRRITTQHGIALIFDEVITGFRAAPGGAQEYFGVRADLATYGKVIGGGMPIGVVAGQAPFLDGIDGGFWAYGDYSYPSVKTTFFAGTFCKHPLAMAAANAVLLRMKADGKSLQHGLNECTAGLAKRLNSFFESDDVPIRTVHFSSLFRFAFSGNMDLFFYHLLDRGVYIWEGRNCFISTAHTQRDLDRVEEAVHYAVAQLRSGGFLDERKPLASSEPKNPQQFAQKEGSLTEHQKQLRLLSLMDSGASVAYNVSVALDLRGLLDIRRLAAAFCYVVNRHDALRTRIEADGERCSFPEYAAADLMPDEVKEENEISQWIGVEHQRPFILESSLLVRARLARISEARHVFLLTAHHIVVDGWSLGIVVDEIAKTYAALVRGIAPHLPPAEQTFDYLEKRLNRLGESKFRADEVFWLGQFADLPSPLELPYNRSASGPVGSDGGSLVRVIPEELWRRVKSFSQSHRSTPFTTLLAVYGALLQRLTQQSDLVIGITTSGRSGEASESVVGYLANLLPLRWKVEPSWGFVQCLDIAKRRLLDALDHDTYTLAELVRRVNPVRDSSARIPLVNVGFNLDRIHDHSVFPGIDARVISVPVRHARFDLLLNAIETSDSLLIEVQYRTDLFGPEQMARVLSFFVQLLEAVIADANQQIGKIWFGDRSERERVLYEWNDTGREVPAQKCVHELFEEQAQRTPDAVAVVFQEQELRYGELNARANQLAHYLRGLGVGPDNLVAICLERSVEMVVAILATLKAGGAYVPLDPAYASERLRLTLEDCRPGVVLLDATGRQALGHTGGGLSTVLDLQVDAGRWVEASQENLDVQDVGICPRHLAYVIYTSGSTGRPKGVMVEHASVVNFMDSMRGTLDVAPEDVLLSVTSISFDIAALELFLPLSGGACVVVATRTEATDAEQLTSLMECRRVSMMQATPSTWRMLTQQPWPKLPRPLKILCGGEVLPANLAQQLLSRAAEVWNLYGPTETTIWSTVHRLTGLQPVIGRPIANTRVYILDKWMQPVPVGVMGELYIGGAGVARGYLNEPELTGQRFIEDPFVAGGRLYRTGDLGRWLEDGNIEYLGRDDFQTKIRGFRIDPGEIEAKLAQVAGVREVVVVAREYAPGEKRLVTYYTGSAQLGDQLREHAARSLPQYMLPTAFVHLERMPLTPNGKLDRKALPAPEGAAYLHRGYEAPQGEIECAIAAIWQDLLHLERVGRQDHFFELGGHSLLAVDVITRMREQGLQVDIRTLFVVPTLLGLAGATERIKRITL
jgi:amino acid adenylation domain-containing protein